MPRTIRAAHNTCRVDVSYLSGGNSGRFVSPRGTKTDTGNYDSAVRLSRRFSDLLVSEFQRLLALEDELFDCATGRTHNDEPELPFDSVVPV